MTDKAYRAKALLLKYRALDNDISAKEECIQHWMDSATRATPSLEAERVSGTSEHSRLEAAMIRKMDMESVVDRKINELREMRRNILNAVDAMDDPNERAMLQFRYIAGKSWAYIMTKMEIPERTSFRMHDSALMHFGEIFF